jgi:hypothetical protein
MKFRSAFLFLALTATAATLSAQIRLVGTRYNQVAQTNTVLRFDASTGVILDSIPTTQSTIALGSTVFDAYAGKYYFRSATGLNSAEFDPNVYAYIGTLDILTGAEIDMANGQIYGATPVTVLDSVGNLVSMGVDFVRYDIDSNITTRLGGFAHTYGVVLDASAYNSNTGDYYFIATDSVLGTCLYTVATRDSTGFSYAQVPVGSATLFLNALEHDNEYNVLYALAMVDVAGSPHLQLYAINPVTGAMALEADWPQLSIFQVSSHTFDQTSSSFILNAGDNTGLALRIYNTVSNTLANGVMPDNVNGVEADNTQFAQFKYNGATIAGDPAQPSIRLYPNPVRDILRLEGGDYQRISIYDAMGRLVAVQARPGITRLSVEALAPGTYYLQAQSLNGGMQAGRFIKE